MYCASSVTYVCVDKFVQTLDNVRFLKMQEKKIHNGYQNRPKSELL